MLRQKMRHNSRIHVQETIQTTELWNSHGCSQHKARGGINCLLLLWHMPCIYCIVILYRSCVTTPLGTLRIPLAINILEQTVRGRGQEVGISTSVCAFITFCRRCLIIGVKSITYQMEQNNICYVGWPRQVKLCENLLQVLNIRQIVRMIYCFGVVCRNQGRHHKFISS